MQKVGRIILIISLCINIGLLVVFLRPNKDIEQIIDEYTFKINSLERDIDSIQKIKDSVSIEIDTVYVKINNNIIHYEKVRNDVLNYSVDDDCKFFANYLDKQRLDSSNNKPTTIKGN